MFHARGAPSFHANSIPIHSAGQSGRSRLDFIERIIFDIEQRESITSSILHDCINSIRSSVRGLTDLTKQEWMALNDFGIRLHSIALNKMEKHDPGAILDTAMLAGRILDAFIQECQDKSDSETAKALETGAWLFLTAAATHQGQSSFQNASGCLGAVDDNVKALQQVVGSNRVVKTLEKAYLFQRVENWISLESSSDVTSTEPSQALSAVAAIRLLLSASSTESHMEEESDDDDEYSLKVGMICFSSSGRYLGLNPPDIHQARRWAKEAELFFGDVAKRRATVLPEHSSVLLLLAKCCIRAGVSASDAKALDEALECLDLVIEIGTDIEIGKFLRLKTLVLLQRWNLIENFLEDEICDSCAEIEDSEIKKWLEYVALVVEGQRWELANSLFRKISDIASRSCSAIERSSWEDAQFTWAFAAAKRMKDYNLTASIVDEIVIAHQNSRLKNPKRMFDLCYHVAKSHEEHDESLKQDCIKWLNRTLVFTVENSQENSKILFRICKYAVKTKEIPVARNHLMQLKCRGQFTACDTLRIAIIDFHLLLQSGDSDGAEAALRSCLVRPAALDGTFGCQSSDFLQLLATETVDMHGSGCVTLARTCIRRIVESLTADAEPPPRMYVDHVFRNYVSLSVDMQSQKILDGDSVSEALFVLAQALCFIDRHGINCFSCGESKPEQTLGLLSDFSWNCAVQQFKHISSSENKDFTDVAKGFHFSSELKLHILEGAAPGHVTNPQHGQSGGTMKQQQQADQTILNEVNLGFFLAGVSYLHNFKEGTKQQGDLLSSRDSLRMINKIRDKYSLPTSNTTKLAELKMEFEIITLISPRGKAEEKALQEIVSRYISVVNEEAGSPHSQHTKIFEGLYALCRFACERQVSACTTSLLCNKSLEIIAVGQEPPTNAAADLYSIIISGFEMGSASIKTIEDVISMATKNPTYPHPHLHFAAIKTYEIGCAIWNAERYREAEMWMGHALRLIGMCPTDQIPKHEADVISKSYALLLEAIAKRE